ncbi:MAG: DNA-directed DNA polymerase [Candidatus Pacearchaeota archaeon]
MAYKTTFIPIDYDSFDFEEKNYVKIIGRDISGKRVCMIDNCDVYLWAILKENLTEKQIEKLIEKIKKIKLDLKGRNTRVEDVQLQNKNFMEKPVKALKIFATNYKDLHDIADKLDMPEIEKRRGYDLGFISHYIIEKKVLPMNWYEIEGEILNNSSEFGGIDSCLEVDYCIKLEKAKLLEKEQNFKPRAIAYDIECDEFQIGKGEILMISLVGENIKKVLTWKKLPVSEKTPNYVEYVKDETELLEKFVEEVKRYSPDFLVGYFSDGFDLPYIKARAEKLRIKIPLGLDGSQPKFSRGNIGMITGRINGIVHIDLLKFIKTAYGQYMQSETLSLNEVAKEFLGDEKKDFKIKHSSKMHEKNWEKYFEYNLHDSVLTLELFEKFWPDILEFTKIIQEPVFELTRAGLSKYTESYILHNLNKFNEIPEKRPSNEEISKRRHIQVEGAFVLEPTPGIYENIAMFDFTSMHTSIIITHNISKSTLLEPEKFSEKEISRPRDSDSKKERISRKPDKNAFESPEIDEKNKKVKYYFTKKPGFFPELMKEIFEKRKQAKADYKKNSNPITFARNNAFKVLSASAHGYVAFFGARYYSHEASASILAFVRKYNKEMIKKVEDAGYKVIFGDTDSAAFLIKDKKESDVNKILEKLNSELPGVMHIELEGIFKRGIWVTTRAGNIGAKKKYALIDKNNRIKIRGFETVRRDWCKLARKVQNKIIHQILEDGDSEKSVEYIKEIVKKLKDREIPKEDLIIRTQLKKPLSEYKAISPHVIAARKMKEQEIPIEMGELIEYYIAEPKENTKSKLVREKVKLPDEEGEYDINYYLERQILPAVENILQVLNVNAKELIYGKRQTCLSDF